jgi:hypothetical protein
MMFLLRKIILLTALSVFSISLVQAQSDTKKPDWGPNDTITVSTILYEGELMPYKELEMVWVSTLPPDKLAAYMEKYNRLRNAVYVTYPYARTAGVTLNQVNAQLKLIRNKLERKVYLKSREKELKTQFADPLSKLSVYQGRVLMKLINRQTGNNCYDIVKEYRGGFSARLWQTVAFFFGSNLKQDYNLKDPTDRQIESIVREIDGVWYNNPYKPGIVSQLP